VIPVTTGANGNISKSFLTLSSLVMPFGIILLILFFICYNFGGLESINPFKPKKIVAFFELEKVNPFQPPKNCSI
jgi:hypothetical protein